MRLRCMHCNKTLKTFHNDELSAFLHRDDEVYYFCSRDCKDKWTSPIAPKKDFDSPQHPTM